MKIEVKLSGRDKLELTLDVQDGQITSVDLKAVGCHSLLTKVQNLRKVLKGPLSDIPLPEGEDHASILLRELVLKAQSKWDFPYCEAELCHCRAIPTAKADEAIVAGAHTVEEVAAMTSAGSACGSCRPDTKKIIAFRLNKKAA